MDIVCSIIEEKEECSKTPWCIFDNKEKHCYWKEDWCYNRDHPSKFNSFTLNRSDLKFIL
jgi:hypothetical protein